MPNQAFQLTARCVRAGKLIGYELTNCATGEVKRLSEENTKEAVRRGYVVGCSIVQREGRQLISKDNGGLRSLPAKEVGSEAPVFMATCRVFAGKQLRGYVIRSISDGKEITLDRSKVWEVARAGKIANVEATVSNNKRMLIGKGCKLIDLPRVNVASAPSASYMAGV